MNSKTKYLLLFLGIVGIILLIFNSIELRYWYETIPELEISKVLFIIGLIAFILYFKVEKWRKLLTKIMIGTFGICLILNLSLFTEYYKNVLRQKRISEYYELKTCKEMETRFAADLKNGEMKYFFFGIGYDKKLAEILDDKYKIETFGMGCMIQSEMICYNELIDKFLKEKYDNSINDIYKEIEIE
jgi:hypothetical protein|tara:strand:+ start:67 stop:627 length:561 start_codon:yes stop_codon:yes gene_type:complete